MIPRTLSLYSLANMEWTLPSMAPQSVWARASVAFWVRLCSSQVRAGSSSLDPMITSCNVSAGKERNLRSTWKND